MPWHDCLMVTVRRGEQLLFRRLSNFQYREDGHDRGASRGSEDGSPVFGGNQKEVGCRDVSWELRGRGDGFWEFKINLLEILG